MSIGIFKTLSKREFFFIIVSYIYILYCVFPLFSYYVPLDVQTICVGTTVLLVSLYPKSLFNKPMFWLFIYLLILLVYTLAGRYIHVNGVSNFTLPASSRILIQGAWVIPSLMIASILCRSKKENLFKIIGIGSLIILLISYIYILPLLSISSNILRDGLFSESELHRPGLPDYTLMHSYVLLLPGICLAIKLGRTKWRVIFAIILALTYFIILKTEVSTSIGVSSIFILYVFIIQKKSSNKTIILLSLGLLLFAVVYYSGLLLTIVDSLLPHFQGTAVELKLRDISNSLSSGSMTGETLEVRAERHDLSRNSFLQNPIFGIGTDEVGRHSHVLDILGSMGLFAFIPFFMIIWTTLKMYLPYSNSRISNLMLYSCFIIAGVFLYSKGIFGSTGWLFMCVIAPSLVIAINYSHNIKKHTS